MPAPLGSRRAIISIYNPGRALVVVRVAVRAATVRWVAVPAGSARSLKVDGAHVARAIEIRADDPVTLRRTIVQPRETEVFGDALPGPAPLKVRAGPLPTPGEGPLTQSRNG